MRPRTRKHTSHWLIGSPDDRILGSKLPSARQVLRYFLHSHLELGQTIRESSRAAIIEANCFWQKANIPTRQVKHSIKKLEALYSRWNNLKKRKSREGTSPSFDKAIKGFQDDLDGLFDIAHADALKVMKIQEDIDFLIMQRKKERPGSMSMAIDMNLAKKIARKQQRLHSANRHKQREANKLQDLFHAVPVENEVIGEDGVPKEKDASAKRDLTYEGTPSQSSSQRVKVITPHFLDMLDRSKISVRKAAAVSLTLAGDRAKNVIMSKSTLHRERIRHRANFDEERAKQEIQQMEPIFLHWDGKILPDITATGTARVDRLPIVATSGSKEKLLGVPKLLTGTGLHQAVAVTEMVKKYEIRSQSKGMVFDTTLSNTGPVKGACVLIEEMLDKELLWIACRHHVLEVVLGDVFHACLGPNKGPTFPLFDRFRDASNSLDTSHFSPLNESDIVIPADERKDIVEFCKGELEDHQPRDDYRKLLKFTLAFLGADVTGGKVFGSPGALSDSRWMAKANYCLYIYMFRRQFTLTKYEEKGLLRVCLFVVRLYLKPWFTCQVAQMAPRSDLDFIKAVREYEATDEGVSAAASKAIGRHLWYLSPYNVALALFDKNVSIETKRTMLINMREKDGEEKPPPRISLTKELTISNIADRNLEDFVTKTKLIFSQYWDCQRSFWKLIPHSGKEKKAT